jgi:DNA-binding transcriptional regulator YdaS (Cro superfamily)
MKQGKALKRFMKDNGIETQAALAAMLDVTPAMVCLYFKGARSFSAKRAIRISKQTGIPMQELYQ